MCHHHAIVSITRIVFVSPVFTLTEIQKTRMENKRIVDPLMDLLINSEDEEDESDSDPDNSEPEHEADTGPSTEEQEFVEYSLSLGQTGRNDTRKVLTSVMN